MMLIDKLIRSGDRRIPPQVLLPAVLIFLSKLATWSVFPNPSIQPDSATYQPNSWLNFELISFTGHAQRGWAVPLLYALIPNGSYQSLFQLMLSSTAWISLIVVSYRLLTNRFAQWFFPIAVAAIAISPFCTQWDTVLLGTSIMVSTNVLIISTLIHIWHKPGLQLPYVSFFIFLDIFLFLQKSSNLLICFFYALLIFIGPMKTVGKNRRLISVFVFAVLFAYGGIVGNNVDRSWNYSYSGTSLLWQLGSQSPASESFQNFLEKNTSSPECVYKEAPFEDVNAGIASVLTNCPEGGEYVKSQLKYNFIEFLVTNPKAGIQLAATSAGAILTGSAASYGKAISLLPSSVDQLFFGEISPSLLSTGVVNQEEGLTAVFEGVNIWLYSPGLLWIFLGFSTGLLSVRRNIKASYQQYSMMLGIPLILLLQLAFTAILLPSEWVRQSAPYYLPLLAMMVLNVSLYIGSRKD